MLASHAPPTVPLCPVLINNGVFLLAHAADPARLCHRGRSGSEKSSTCRSSEASPAGPMPPWVDKARHHTRRLDRLWSQHVSRGRFRSPTAARSGTAGAWVGLVLRLRLHERRLRGTPRPAPRSAPSLPHVRVARTCTTTMEPTAAAACAARGEGASPSGVIFSHFPVLTSKTCTSLVAPARRMPAGRMDRGGAGARGCGRAWAGALLAADVLHAPLPRWHAVKRPCPPEAAMFAPAADWAGEDPSALFEPPSRAVAPPGARAGGGGTGVITLTRPQAARAPATIETSVVCTQRPTEKDEPVQLSDRCETVPTAGPGARALRWEGSRTRHGPRRSTSIDLHAIKRCPNAKARGLG
jgi:hypothetical protein